MVDKVRRLNREIIDNFPIESTDPPRSTHGGNFELPNKISVT